MDGGGDQTRGGLRWFDGREVVDSMWLSQILAHGGRSRSPCPWRFSRRSRAPRREGATAGSGFGIGQRRVARRRRCGASSGGVSSPSPSVAADPDPEAVANNGGTGLGHAVGEELLTVVMRCSVAAVASFGRFWPRGRKDEEGYTWPYGQKDEDDDLVAHVFIYRLDPDPEAGGDNRGAGSGYAGREELLAGGDAMSGGRRRKLRRFGLVGRKDEEGTLGLTAKKMKMTTRRPCFHI
ncbi:hypothetical protein Dimus_013011 [Dionaea muscipula]